MNGIFESKLLAESIYIPFTTPIKVKYLTIGFTGTTTTNLDVVSIIYYTLVKGTKNELVYDFIRKKRRG